jgi:hypothetical protein
MLAIEGFDSEVTTPPSRGAYLFSIASEIFRKGEGEGQGSIKMGKLLIYLPGVIGSSIL